MSRDHPVLTLAGGVAIGGALATFTLWRYWKPIYKAYTHEGVGVGILGTGWGIKVQVPRFREAGLRILALYSRDKERGNEMAEKARILCAFTEVHALCQVNEVEIVSVVTPPYLHLEHTLAALDSGKHVLVEKPMALTSAEGEQMVAAAAARPDLLAIVDHECRFTPAFLRAREHLRKGTIGPILAIEISAMVFHPQAQTLKPWYWWNDRSAGGGAWGAIGSHLIDSLRFLLDAEVLEVAAYLRSTYPFRPGPDGKDKEVTADDYGSVQLKLGPRGEKATPPSFDGPQPFINAHATMAVVGASKAGARIVLSGAKGGLELNFTDSSLRVNDASGKIVDKTVGRGNMFTQVGTRALGVALQRALGPKQDRSALEPAATLEDGLAVLYVLEAGWQSSDNGSMWVKPKHVTPRAPAAPVVQVNLPPAAKDAAPAPGDTSKPGAASTVPPAKAAAVKGDVPAAVPTVAPVPATPAPVPAPATPPAGKAAPPAPAVVSPAAGTPAGGAGGPPRRSQSAITGGSGTAGPRSPETNPKYKPTRQA